MAKTARNIPNILCMSGWSFFCGIGSKAAEKVMEQMKEKDLEARAFPNSLPCTLPETNIAI